MADSVVLSGEEIEVRFSGARIASAYLSEFTDSALPADLYSLWNWIIETTDHDRRYALQQAASLAIFNSADLGTAASPVLRTAKSIYDLARRGAVAEAVATRRTVRISAIDAAAKASEVARGAGARRLRGLSSKRARSPVL
jgi:hypothetical protein